MLMRWLLAAGFVVVTCGAAGCAGNDKQPREHAKQRWNAARAGVVLGLASQQFRAGEFDNCRKTLDDALVLDPTNAQIHLLSARLDIERSRLESAERQLQTVRQLDPKNPEAHYLSGVIYQRWQRPETALDFYSKASELAPAELAYLLAKAEMLVLLDRSPEALGLLKDKVIYFENSAAIRDAVGQILLQLNRSAEAVEMLRQAHTLASDDQTIREHYAMALFYARRHAEAVRVIGKMVEEERFAQRGDLHLALGQSLLEVRRPRDARDAFETASQIDPASAAVWLGLGKAALELNDLRRAELSVVKASTLEPTNPEAALLAGYLRVRQGRLDEALLAFRKAVALDRNDTVALCMVGYVLEKQGKSTEAMDCYARALKLKPNDELAARLMAQVQLGD